MASTRIVLFDQITLDFAVARDGDGGYAVRRLLALFPDRRCHPHLSLFAAPRFDLHFTAAGGGRAFRRRLLDLPLQNVAEGAGRLAAETGRRFVTALEPVDLDEIEACGWMAHAADSRVLLRWARRAARSQEVHVNIESVVALTSHVLENAARPSALKSLADGNGRRFLAARHRSDADRDLRQLLWYPDGYWTQSEPDGKAHMSRPPGWYWYNFGSTDQAGLQDLLPVELLKRKAAEIGKYLRRFPRRGTSIPSVPLDQIPRFVSTIAGFYAGDLLTALLIAREENSYPTQ
ncbi:MAG: hypothetical protein WC526_00890 [Patescibacteria group bacterium]